MVKRPEQCASPTAMWGLAKRGMRSAAASGEQGSWSAVLVLADTSVIQRMSVGMGFRVLGRVAVPWEWETG